MSITFNRIQFLKTKGECNEMPDQGISADCCAAMQPGLDGAGPAADDPANEDVASRAEFRYGDRPNDAGAQTRELADPSRQLSSLGLQSARPDQQRQC